MQLSMVFRVTSRLHRNVNAANSRLILVESLIVLCEHVMGTEHRFEIVLFERVSRLVVINDKSGASKTYSKLDFHGTMTDEK